jgi:hypothetical protein
MAYQPEVANYDTGVYQLEITDPVQGGVGGVSNAPILNLANRTAWLYQQLNTLLNGTFVPSSYAPINSPTFTGTPAAPTPAIGDNSTKIATTAFVQNAANGRLSLSVAGSSNVTLTAAQAGYAILTLTGALTANISILVPTSAGQWVVENSTTGAYTLTVKTAAGTGIAVTQGQNAELFCDGTNVQASTTDYPSIALTGVPTAPTAAVSTNTTQIATTAFVVGQAGTAAPVMNGTAAVGTSTLFARQDHVHPTDSTRAPLASPTFTGTPAAPTATAGTSTTQIATTAFVATSYAPLASPALTGTPTAPTAAVNTNTAQLATTAFVINQASGTTPLMDGTAAVGSGTTWARADHVHPTDSTRAPLLSPVFTGAPSLPTGTTGVTQAVGNSSTALATTAFVKAAGIQASSATVLTANTILTAANAGGSFYGGSASAITLTLPAASAVPAGARFHFLNENAGVVTVTRAGSDAVVVSTVGGLTSLALGAGDTLTLESNGTSGWFAVGGSVQLQYAAAFSSSIGGTGYQKLPSGVIIQWGNVSSNAAGLVTWTLPIAFPNAIFVGVANYLNSGTGSSTSAPTARISSSSTKSIVYVICDSTTGVIGSAGVHVIVIGY